MNLTSWLRKIFRRPTAGDVTPAERRAVWVMAAVLVAFTLLPAAFGYLTAFQKHQAWTGVNVFGSEDMQVYLSNIDQVRRGHWLITNQFTSEPSYPYLSPVWLVVGLMARFGGLDPLFAFFVARLLAAILLVWVAHWSLRQFLRSRGERLAALGLLLFGCGLGRLFGNADHGVMHLPIDQWVPEAFVIRSSLYSPHFLLAWMLFIIIILTLMFRAYRDGRWRDAVLAGAASFTLILFHPYHAPSIFLVSGLALVVMSLASLKLFWRRVGALAILAAMTAPAAVYQLWILQPERNGPHAFSGNICWTPALPYVLLGFGAFVPMAIVGVSLWHRRQVIEERLPGLFLVTWLIAQSLMIYAPTMLQRRFTQGLLFPLAAFSGLTLVAIWQWVERQPKDLHTYYRLGLVVASLSIFMMTPVASFYDDLPLLRGNSLGIVFLDKHEEAMYAWMRQYLPEQAVVVSKYWTGDLMPARTTARAYYGHWGQTIDVKDKEADVTAFFTGKADAAWSKQFLTRAGIGYVYYGHRERVKDVDLGALPFLEVVHREGDEILYRVR